MTNSGRAILVDDEIDSLVYNAQLLNYAQYVQIDSIVLGVGLIHHKLTT
jgi:hypothetical protein